MKICTNTASYATNGFSIKSSKSANGLFDDYDTATFCLDCMMAPQSVRPNMWEDKEVKFDVIGLWKVIE